MLGHTGHVSSTERTPRVKSQAGKHSVPGTEERTRTPNIVANDASRAKPNGCLVAEVPKGERKVRMLHDTCNGAWNISSKNQGDLEIVKQEVGHLNVVAFSVSEAN